MNTETIPSATETDLFSEEELVSYDLASNGQRFINYLIDYIVMYLGVGYLSGYLIAQLVLAISPETAYSLFSEGSNMAAVYLIALFNHVFYYTICEKAFKGYTLGKLITGTRAIKETGEELTFKDALLRSLCRLVPFEAFSIWFGNGMWHDAWTKTRVIKSR